MSSGAPGFLRSEVREGISASWTVALGLLPLGLAFGLLVSQSGFAWWWTPIFSVVVYAGSMEFLAVTLVTGGVAPLSAAVYAFLVNFRHIFYGLSYPTTAVHSPLAKAYGVYALTDETYAILSSRRHAAWTQPRVITVQLFCQLSWVVPGILGALVGAALPMDIQGLDFALTALFVVLAMEAMDTHRDPVLPAVAVVAGVVGLLISRDQMLLIGLSLYFVFLVGRFLWDQRGERGEGELRHGVRRASDRHTGDGAGGGHSERSGGDGEDAGSDADRSADRDGCRGAVCDGGSDAGRSAVDDAGHDAGSDGQEGGPR